MSRSSRLAQKYTFNLGETKKAKEVSGSGLYFENIVCVSAVNIYIK